MSCRDDKEGKKKKHNKFQKQRFDSSPGESVAAATNQHAALVRLLRSTLLLWSRQRSRPSKVEFLFRTAPFRQNFCARDVPPDSGGIVLNRLLLKTRISLWFVHPPAADVSTMTAHHLLRFKIQNCIHTNIKNLPSGNSTASPPMCDCDGIAVTSVLPYHFDDVAKAVLRTRGITRARHVRIPQEPLLSCAGSELPLYSQLYDRTLL